MVSAKPKAGKGGSSRVQGTAGFVMDFMDKGGVIDVDRVATMFRMTKGQLAETAGLATATISKTDRDPPPIRQELPDSPARGPARALVAVREFEGADGATARLVGGIVAMSANREGRLMPARTNGTPPPEGAICRGGQSQG